MDQGKMPSLDLFPHACIHTCTYPYYKYIYHNCTTRQTNKNSLQSTKARVTWPCSFPGCVVYCSHRGFLCSSHALPALLQGLFISHLCRFCCTASHSSSVLVSDGSPSVDYLHPSRNKPAVLFAGLLPHSKSHGSFLYSSLS